MLQRVLASSPEIHTAGEPWVMLHAIYSLRETGIETEYDAELALRALHAFHEQLPEHEQTYWTALRRMYGYLYEQATVGTGASIFLDKTPRYYLILPELRRVFPRAKIVILVRHPLAVASSIFSSWLDGEWSELHKYAVDLVDAPKLILSFIDEEDDSALVVRYEEFVAAPSASTRTLCEELGVTYVDGMENYGTGEPWQLGDQGLAFSVGRPNESRIESWKEAFVDPQSWRCASDYLELLGPSLLESLGYSYGRARDAMDRARPSSMRLLSTRPLSHLLPLMGSRQMDN